MCNWFLSHTENFIFDRKVRLRILTEKSLAGNGKVHKSAIQTLKLWNEPSRPIGFFI